MRLEDLHTLLNIQRYGSINKAAQNAFLSHSSIMYVLQSVEKELGYPVFIRSKQGVTPTPRGTQFLIDAQAVLEITDKWFIYSKSKTAPEGNVQVTMIPAVSKILASDLLLHLRADYPKLNVDIIEKKYFTTNELLAAMKKAYSRIFVGTLPPFERSMFEDELSQQRQWSYVWMDIDTLALHISADNPMAGKASLSVSELAELPILFYPDSGKKFGFTEVIRYFPNRQVYNISMADSVLELTASNSAVVLASKMVTRSNELVQTGQIRTIAIEGHPMPMSYYIVYPSKVTHAEQVVISRITETFNSFDEGTSGSAFLCPS